MEEKQRMELMDYLKTSLEITSSWIYRKEIAAWSSVILYFTALFGFYKLSKDISGVTYVGTFALSLIVCIISILFIVFLWKQYGSLCDGMAKVQAFSIWMVKVLNKHDDLSNFDFRLGLNDTVPVSISKTVTKRYALIRSETNIWGILIIPIIMLKKIFSGKTFKYDNLVCPRRGALFTNNFFLYFTCCLSFFIII